MQRFTLACLVVFSLGCDNRNGGSATPEIDSGSSSNGDGGIEMAPDPCANAPGHHVIHTTESTFYDPQVTSNALVVTEVSEPGASAPANSAKAGIRVIRSNGTSYRIEDAAIGDETHGAFVVGGDWIYFMSPQERGNHLYVVPLEDGTSRRLAPDVTYDWDTELWAADERFVYLAVVRTDGSIDTHYLVRVDRESGAESTVAKLGWLGEASRWDLGPMLFGEELWFLKGDHVKSVSLTDENPVVRDVVFEEGLLHFVVGGEGIFTTRYKVVSHYDLSGNLVSSSGLDSQLIRGQSSEWLYTWFQTGFSLTATNKKTLETSDVHCAADVQVATESGAFAWSAGDITTVRFIEASAMRPE